MRYIRLSSLAAAALLSISAQANAQTALPPQRVNFPAQAPEGAVIGPDGTYYVLVPSATSTLQARSTQLLAIAVSGAVKWTATITGDIGPVLPGITDVYVEQTTTSGSGTSTTAATSVLVLSASTGVQGSPITPPSGAITQIQEKTVGSTDYLYIVTVATTVSSSGGTTTRTTTDTLSIYSNGTLVKSVNL